MRTFCTGSRRAFGPRPAELPAAAPVGTPALRARSSPYAHPHLRDLRCPADHNKRAPRQPARCPHLRVDDPPLHAPASTPTHQAATPRPHQVRAPAHARIDSETATAWPADPPTSTAPLSGRRPSLVTPMCLPPPKTVSERWAAPRFRSVVPKPFVLAIGTAPGFPATERLHPRLSRAVGLHTVTPNTAFDPRRAIA